MSEREAREGDDDHIDKAGGRLAKLPKGTRDRNRKFEQGFPPIFEKVVRNKCANEGKKRLRG